MQKCTTAAAMEFKPVLEHLARTLSSSSPIIQIEADLSYVIL